MIISNVFRALTPVFALLALAFSTLLDESHCALFLLFSFSYLLVPLFLTVLRTARYVGRRFYSTVMQNVWKSICSTLYSLCSLAYNAQLSLDALIRVLYRMLVSHKKLLEWVTAGEIEKKYGKSHTKLFFLYVLKALPSLIAALLLLLFSAGGVVRLLAVSFLLFPSVSFLLSVPYKKKEPIGEKEKDRLKEYARESFAYFEHFVTESDHYLPPDNYEELPVSTLARRTSPTNIGLYMLSVASMKELGYLDDDACVEKIGLTLRTVIELPKYKGHLYNWYDTENLSILGRPYISTVDSGNFVMALLCLSGVLRKSENENAADMVKAIEGLINETDFSFLYNEKKKMLAIGYDPVEEKQSENCYDLLSSEARSAYYFAVAKGQIPQMSFYRPARPVTVKDGHLGILSWSGTAFEYFMPTLFLPLYENTMLYEALCFALFEQVNDKTRRLWGRSESCYYAFDEQMNYQYKAFGCASLALDPSIREENVIAPYASFLALCLSPQLVLENLTRLEEAGAKGAYGFYEAIDFTRSRVGNGCAVIRAYMSHHIGMSIVSIANACCDRVFIKALLDNEEMNAATELLSEGVPSDAPTSRVIRKKPQLPSRFFYSLGVRATPEKNVPDYAFLHRDGMGILAAGTGELCISYSGICLSPPICAERSYKEGFSLCVRTDHALHTFREEDIRFFFDGNQIGFTDKTGAENAELRITAGSGGTLILHAEAPGEEKCTLLSSFPLPLGTKEELLTHPAFCGLLVESEYSADENILIFRKRKRESTGKDLYFGITLGSAEPFEYLTSFSDIEDCPPKELTGELLLRRLPCVAGSTRKPFAAIKAMFSKSIDLIFAVGKTKEQMLSGIIATRKQGEKTDLFSSALKRNNTIRKYYPSGVSPDRETICYTSLMLSGICKRRNCRIPLPRCAQNELWRYGISGDYPIFTFSLPEERLTTGQKKIIKGLVKAQSYLFFGGVKCDLVFIRKETDNYFSPVKNEFSELLLESVGNSMLNYSGGIHLLCEEGAKEVLPSFSRVYLQISSVTIFETLKKQFNACLENDKKEIITQIGGTIGNTDENEDKSGVKNENIRIDENKVRILRSTRQLPQSYIYASRQFGTLLTNRSLGFTYFRNAGEFRLTPFSGEEREDHEGEKLLLSFSNCTYDLCACSAEVSYKPGFAEYKGALPSLDYSVFVGVDDKLPVKLICLVLNNRCPVPVDYTAEYRVIPCLNKIADGNITAKNYESAVFYKRTAATETTPPFMMYVLPQKVGGVIAPGEEKRLVFLLGTCSIHNDKCFYYVRERFGSSKEVFASFERYEKCYSALLSSFSVSGIKKELSLMFNRYLPYQTLTSRIFARTGFYQPGGAYGFRDQLQDTLCMLPYDDDLLMLQILRCANHQYVEGDVQHWWHKTTVREGSGDFGVRTHCSDDLLFLPYACAIYVKTTGKREILQKEVRYISSKPLLGDADRYERPERAMKESVYFHCMRAIEYTAGKRSARGLCLMGSCDWNDGLSEVRGESVWLTQFFAIVTREFAEIARESEKEYLLSLANECGTALTHCYSDRQYYRAYTDRGEILGKEGNGFCEIDLLPQAFSVFLQKDKKSRSAIDKAYDRLYDRTHRLFRLFAPSYDSESPFPGYLGGYCPGFRENGGQYTHAAVWGAAALLEIGEYERGYEVTESLCPLRRAKNDMNYKIEPYAMAGDVYYAGRFSGRGGWSMYTGAAGWYTNVFLTSLVGYKESKDGFTLHPKLSDPFPSFSLTVRKHDSVYHIDTSLGKEDSVTLDGRSYTGDFLFDRQEHFVKIVLQNSKNRCIL